MAWLFRYTFPFGMWEWDTGNQSAVDSQPAGPHTSGVTTDLSTGQLSPRPEGALGTLQLRSPPSQLSTGNMNVLNIQLTQMCTMCTMPPDTWKRGNFRRQVSTGRRNHITGHSGSPWNTGPWTMSCLNQLSSGQTNPPGSRLTRRRHTTNP